MNSVMIGKGTGRIMNMRLFAMKVFGKGVCMYGVCVMEECGSGNGTTRGSGAEV